MKSLKLIMATALFGSSIQAVPIELFKSKRAVRFDNHGITMQAKIKSIDCNYHLGYASSPKSCRVTAQHQLQGQRDRDIFLIFNRNFEQTLHSMKNSGSYRFVSCIYSHKKKLMIDCSIK